MAKVNIKFDKKEVTLRLKQTFSKVKRNRQMQTEIGTFLVNRIQSEAKSGRPYNKTRSYPDLKESTKANRKRLAKYNNTGSPFRAALSNTLLTGQFTNSLVFRPVDNNEVVEIGFEKKNRKPYVTNKNGGKAKLKSGVNATNKDLFNTLKEIGFVFFDPKVIAKDDKITKRVRSIVLKTLRRALRAARGR